MVSGYDPTKLGGVGQVVAKQLEELTGLEARNTTLGYMAPLWILVFQAKMRQLEMEDEVMQFQTIILMLMKLWGEWGNMLQ